MGKDTMLRTIRRFAALAMIPAALTLVAAAPAGATGTGEGDEIGIAYRNAFYRGPSVELRDTGGSCTTITAIDDGVQSAVNFEGSGRVITFYLGHRCEIPFTMLFPGESNRAIGELSPRSYRTTPG
ncbi:hypothetical protein ACWF94_14620 [Streptomyces sp. NPDC055078]